MKRAQAIAAIDEAFADGLKSLFGVLVKRIESGDADAAKAFTTGIGFHDEAHSAALAAIETIFPE